MALPQLPAHAQHQLGQRVIEQGTRSREYMQKSRTTVRLFSCMQSLLCQERVLFWEIQTIFFLKFARSSRGGENPLFARYARVIKQLSTTKTTHGTSFCALRSQHLLWQMCPSLSLFTTDYPPLSGRWNGIAFPYPSHFLPLYLPTKHRETTERSPRDERLKIAVNFDQNLQFSHLIPLAPTIHHCVNFSDIPCKVSLHFLNMSKITTSTISIA